MKTAWERLYAFHCKSQLVAVASVPPSACMGMYMSWSFEGLEEGSR